MLVSIIIPTRNAADTLEACLKSIKSQDYPSVEIIIADNYSKDGTREIGKKYGAKVVVCGPPPPHNNFFTAPIQRAIGATHASGEFLLFIDADMILEKGLIRECVEKCLKEADAIAIPEISFGEGFWSECKVLERTCYFHPLFKDQIIQACRFFKRSVYEVIGGWRKDVGFLDDWDITARLRASGFKMRMSKHHIYHNEGRQTLKKIALKKYNFGKGANFSAYLSSSKSGLKTILHQLTPFRILSILIRLPKVSRNLINIIGVVLMKSVEGLALIIGVISKALMREEG